VVNAYGEDVITSARASDILFAAIQGGKTTFGELADSLSVVTGAAVANNIPFEQVGAALATITATGTTTNVAATQLRSVLTELSREGSKASVAFEGMQHEMVPVGQTFAEFIADGGTLAEALQYLNESAEANGENFRNMFSRVEAANAAFVLGASNVDKM